VEPTLPNSIFYGSFSIDDHSAVTERYYIHYCTIWKNIASPWLSNTICSSTAHSSIWTRRPREVSCIGSSRYLLITIWLEITNLKHIFDASWQQTESIPNLQGNLWGPRYNSFGGAYREKMYLRHVLTHKRAQNFRQGSHKYITH